MEQGFTLRIFLPYKYDVHIECVSRDNCRFDYVEVVRRPEEVKPEDFKRMVEETKKLLEASIELTGRPCRLGIDGSSDEARVTLQCTGISMHYAADFLVGEMMLWSRLGEVRLRDILLMAGLTVTGEYIRRRSIEEMVKRALERLSVPGGGGAPAVPREGGEAGR